MVVHADNSVDHAQMQKAKSIVQQLFYRLLPYSFSARFGSDIHTDSRFAVACIKVEEINTAQHLG